VGSIHGGAKHNIIPDEVKLQLTVRSYKEDVRKRLLAAIDRIAKAEAAAAGAPRPPDVKVTVGDDATYNDPVLAKRLSTAFSRAFGPARVVESPPVMGAEDFGYFGKAAGVPSVIFWVGGVPEKKYDAAKNGGAPLPSLHSSEWAPDREPTLKTGTAALTVAALELLGKP
jgi:hippurate hydrolase